MLPPHASVPQHDSNVRTQIVLNSGTPRRRGKVASSPSMSNPSSVPASRPPSLAAPHLRVWIQLRPATRNASLHLSQAIQPYQLTLGRFPALRKRDLSCPACWATLAKAVSSGPRGKKAGSSPTRLRHLLCCYHKLGPFPSSRLDTWFFWTGKSWLLVCSIDEMAFRSGRSLRFVD